MPSITREQVRKWSKNLPEGWKFDIFHYSAWGEKRIFTDGPADPETGVFYRLQLDYREHYPDRYSRSDGQQITAKIYRYNPTGIGEMYNVVGILDKVISDLMPRKNYNTMIKYAATIDPEQMFQEAAEKDTGHSYNTIGA